MQPNLFERLEQAAVPALGDEELDLLGRVDVAMAGRGDAEQLQQEDAAAVEQSDRRSEEPLRPLHRQHGQERHARRILQRERLGDELAENHGEYRQHEQYDQGRRRVGGIRIESPDSRDKRSQACVEAALRVGAEDQAGEGDPDLRGSNVSVEGLRALDHGQNTRGQDVAILREPPQPAPPRADG
jgi:hypothetical protein